MTIQFKTTTIQNTFLIGQKITKTKQELSTNLELLL